MKNPIRIFILFIIILLGLSTMVFAGSSEAPNNLSASKIWLGNAGSQIEIYFISDWYCPYCRAAETAIEEMIPEIRKVSRYTFADLPVHRESTGFIPYNLSLLLHDKKRYVSARHALLNVAEKTRSPTDQGIRIALAQKGINFKMADFSEIFQTSNQIAALLRGSGVKLTPSVLIRNRRSGGMRILKGTEQIQGPIVMATIRALEG